MEVHPASQLAASPHFRLRHGGAGQQRTAAPWRPGPPPGPPQAFDQLGDTLDDHTVLLVLDALDAQDGRLALDQVGAPAARERPPPAAAPAAAASVLRRSTVVPTPAAMPPTPVQFLDTADAESIRSHSQVARWWAAHLHGYGDGEELGSRWS